MTKAKLQELVTISLKVLHGEASEGDKFALQMFLMIASKREENAYEKALKVAINEQVRAHQRAQFEAKRAAERAKWDF